MPFKYIFIGLPGVGKTTIMKAMCSTLPATRLFLMDDHIKIRLNKLMINPQAVEQLKRCSTDDPIVNHFYEKWCKEFDSEKVMQALLRKFHAKHSSAIMQLLGESQWRELEAAIAVDYLKKEQGCGFDLGGSQPFNATVREICHNLGIKFIYLQADHETICVHLSQQQSDGKPKWQHISNYQAAGNEVWKALANKHRKERENILKSIADITIDVSYLSVEEVILKIKVAIFEYELKTQNAGPSSKFIEKNAPVIIYRQLNQSDGKKQDDDVPLVCHHKQVHLSKL